MFSDQIDENVALIPNRGKQGWKSGSGSITKTGSGSFQYRDTLEGGIGSRATPTTKNRFSALVGGSGGMEYSHRAGGRYVRCAPFRVLSFKSEFVFPESQAKSDRKAGHVVPLYPMNTGTAGGMNDRWYLKLLVG